MMDKFIKEKCKLLGDFPAYLFWVSVSEFSEMVPWDFTTEESPVKIVSSIISCLSSCRAFIKE